MKVLRVFLALVITMVFLVFLPTCNQILYYLSQVYKVHGTVTVDGTDPPAPIGSVEVFVGDFQYSELTNYYGDYEMELAEGTWTINFRKEGYEPVTAEVTLSPENMRERLDVSMVWIQPPSSIDLTGYWDWFFTPECDPEEPDCESEEFGPITLGMQQTDSTLVTDLMDFSGSISDSVFILSSDEAEVCLTGTVSGSGDQIEITGTFTGDVLGGSGTFRIVPTGATFGTLYAKGTVDGAEIFIDTEFAMGNGGALNYRYEYIFPLDIAGVFTGDLWLQTSKELTVGSYTVANEPWEDDYISVSLGGLNAIEEDDNGYQVQITRYDNSGIAGSFNLKLADGSMVAFTIPYESPVLPSSTNLWSYSQFEVNGWDPHPVWIPDGVYLVLWLGVNGALTEKPYTVGNWWLSIEWDSPSASLESFLPTDTGTLTIEHFDNDGMGDDDGIAGFFNASGVWGSLEGEFNVYFYPEWEP